MQTSFIISLASTIGWQPTRSDYTYPVPIHGSQPCNCIQCLLWHRYAIILHYHAVCISNFCPLWTSLGHQISGFTIVCIVAGCTTALFQQPSSFLSLVWAFLTTVSSITYLGSQCLLSFSQFVCWCNWSINSAGPIQKSSIYFYHQSGISTNVGPLLAVIIVIWLHNYCDFVSSWCN